MQIDDVTPRVMNRILCFVDARHYRSFSRFYAFSHASLRFLHMYVCMCVCMYVYVYVCAVCRFVVSGFDLVCYAHARSSHFFSFLAPTLTTTSFFTSSFL